VGRDLGCGDGQRAEALTKGGDRRAERRRPQQHADRRVGVVQILQCRRGEVERELRVESDR
jgi:hypothetical protein